MSQTLETAQLSAEENSRFVQTDPYRIHYYELGDRSARTVVLLHGSGPGATGWSNFLPNLAALAESFHVFSVDMPGWGESETQSAEKGYDHPATLIKFFDAVGIDKAALIGNSMGGMTSVSTAVRFPERVTHLVTMGTPCPGIDVFNATGVSEGMKVLLHAYREPTAENMKKLVQIMCYDQSMATDELAQMRSDAALAHTSHLDDYNRPDPTKPPVSNPGYFTFIPQLAELAIPTLTIHGRDDRVVSYEHSLRFVSLIPDARALLIGKCGHWAQIEHAAEFNRAVTDFVLNA